MKDFENLGAYLPNLVIHHVLQNDMLVPPQTQVFKGNSTVCLFADVSGFTAISEALCALGDEGVEELASQLNKFVAQLVKLTSRAGGDVIKFAGDALVAIWVTESALAQSSALGANSAGASGTSSSISATSSSKGKKLLGGGGDANNDEVTVLLQRAIQCALDIQLRLASYKFKVHHRDLDGRDIPDQVRYSGDLSVKITIGLGDVMILHLGGEPDNIMSERYEFVASGSALEEAYVIENFAKPGEVLVSKSAYERTKAFFEYEHVPESGKSDKKCYHAKAWKQEVRWKKETDESKFRNVTDEGEARIWKYVPAAVLPYLAESNEFWAPELRRVTTLFCNLGFTNEHLLHPNPADMQFIFTTIQESVFQFEGTINKFLVDDKGSTLIAVFGLPPFAHENDATRGVLAAMSILSQLQLFDKNGSIGITTGVAFCGVVGTRGNRREYSVIGDTINTAARLMVEAKRRNVGHLMDRATAVDTADDLATEKTGSVLLKGKASEIEIFQVAGGAEAPSLQFQRVTGYHPPMKSASSFTTSVPVSPKAVEDKKKKKKTTLPSTTSKATGTSPSPATSSISSPSTPVGGAGPAIEHKDSTAGRSHREQVAAITEAPRLRKIRDEALRSRVVDRDKALARGVEGFAQQSQAGLQMGSGRARTESALGGGGAAGKSPAPVVLSKSRLAKAAKIRFDDGGASPDLVSTFTLPLVDGMETLGDLKEAALVRQGSRNLLRRGPNADRSLFAFQSPSDPSKFLSDATSLDAVAAGTDGEGGGPVLKLTLVEHKDAAAATAAAGKTITLTSSSAGGSPGKTKPAKRSSVTGGTNGQESSAGRDEVLRAQLEDVRDALVDAGRGRVVVLEGAQGVGKTRLAAQVILAEGGAVNEAITGVAMGNPYETERLSTPFSVWTVLLRQLVEDTVALKGQPLPEDPVLRSELFRSVLRAAARRADPTLADGRADGDVDDVVDSFERKTASPRMSFQPGDTTPVSSPRAKYKTHGFNRAQFLANLVLGLSMENPVIVLIDDSHFMDFGSWNLTLKLADFITARNARVLVVLLHRSLILADWFSAPTPVTAASSAASSNNNSTTTTNNNNKSNTNNNNNSKGAAGGGKTATAPGGSNNNNNKPPPLAPLRSASSADERTVGNTTTTSKDIFAGVDRHNMRAIDNEFTRTRREIAKLYDDLLNREGVLQLEKRPNPASTEALIKEMLQVDAVPQELGGVLQRKSQGNALYIRDALALYRDEKLLEVKGRTVTLSDSFREKSKYHELPVPHSVEGICATLLDTMSTTQQMALKVAAMVGETFPLSLIEAVFPIVALKPNVRAEWDALVRLGVVAESGVKSATGSAPGATEPVYSFSNGWMIETLCRRMLLKQRRKLNEFKKLVMAEMEENTRMQFMQTTVNKITVSMTGWLNVRKDHARNMLRPWKRRWVVLSGDELVQYYDQEDTRRLEVINLRGEGTMVSIRPGGFMGLESNFGERHYPFCFQLRATSWVKKGVEMSEPHDFFMAPDTEQEHQQWVFKLGYQIDFYRLTKREALLTNGGGGGGSGGAGGVGGGGGGEGAGNGAGGRGDKMLIISPITPTATSEPSILPSEDFAKTGSHLSTVAGLAPLPGENSGGGGVVSAAPSIARAGTTLLNGLTGRKSISASNALPPPPRPGTRGTERALSFNRGDVTKGLTVENPGASIARMTASHFKAISQDRALALFWARADTTLDDVLVLRSSHHVTWFYEFGDMGLVSLTGNGFIDGYLMGFVSSRQPDHAVVHQCAVVPNVRRKKIGTRLYKRFYENAKRKGCKYVHAMVPKNSVEAIAFHRALGFEEMTGEEDKLRDLGGEYIVFVAPLP